MPSKQIDKARRIVLNSILATKLSVFGHKSLLGSLQHMATGIRPERVFLQRLRHFEFTVFRVRDLSVWESVRSDLSWRWQIIHEFQLNGTHLA